MPPVKRRPKPARTTPKPAKSTPKPAAARDTSNNGDNGDSSEDAAARDDDPFYCPGCGRRYKFLTECRGMSNAAPHPPILVVSTDELDGDPEDFTPAPPGGDPQE